MEYFVLGEREIVLGFKLAGVDGKEINNREEALKTFNALTGNSTDRILTVQEIPKILILTEDVSDMLSQEVLAWQLKGKAPLIVEIPGLGGHIPGRKTLTDSIREAVGIQM